LKEYELDFSIKKFLVLLLMLQSEMGKGLDCWLGTDEGLHPFIDRFSVIQDFTHPGPCHQASLIPVQARAKRDIVRVKDIIKLLILSGYRSSIRLEDVSDKKPAGMRQVPPRGADFDGGLDPALFVAEGARHI
jgi:hypothetical protein